VGLGGQVANFPGQRLRRGRFKLQSGGIDAAGLEAARRGHAPADEIVAERIVLRGVLALRCLFQSGVRVAKLAEASLFRRG